MTDIQRIAANKIVNIELMLTMIESRCKDIVKAMDEQPTGLRQEMVEELIRTERTLEELMWYRG